MKNFLKNILALAIGCVLVFLIMEGILRVYNPFDFRVKGNKIVLPINEKYVIRKYRGEDNVEKQHKKLDSTIIHTKNSLGFRGDEPPSEFEKYLTIITIGGSTTECTYLSDGKTWADIIGKKLKGKFTNIWINNAGFDGHSTYGHKILMEDYIVKLNPNIVLFLTGANDQGINDFRENDQEFMRNKFIFSSFKSFLKSLANYSEIFSLGLNMYRYGKANIEGIAHAIIDFEVFRNVNLKKYLTDDFLRKQREAIANSKKYNLPGYEKRLKGLIQISKHYNIIPVLITQPALYGDFVDDVTNINFRFTKFNWELLELYNDVTRKVGFEENILVVDLAKEMPKNTKYYYDWFHFTNEGAEKVAEIVYNVLFPYLAINYKKNLL